VGEELFATVQEQLKANQQVARGHSRGARYLLQGLIKCSCCQYAYYGNTIRRSTKKSESRYEYYRCLGTDAYRFGGQRVCHNPQVSTELLDNAIWRDVQQLLRDPDLLRHEYERRLKKPSAGTSRERTLRQQEKSAHHAISRLIDAFTEGLLDKSEFEPRVTKARQRAQRLTEELAQLNASDAEQANLRAALSGLEEFMSQIRNGLDNADWNTRREIIRLLVERISIEPSQIQIIYRITFPLFLQTTQVALSFVTFERFLQFCSRRPGGSACSRILNLVARELGKFQNVRLNAEPPSPQAAGQTNSDAPRCGVLNDSRDSFFIRMVQGNAHVTQGDQ